MPHGEHKTRRRARRKGLAGNSRENTEETARECRRRGDSHLMKIRVSAGIMVVCPRGTSIALRPRDNFGANVEFLSEVLAKLSKKAD